MIGRSSKRISGKVFKIHHLLILVGDSMHYLYGTVAKRGMRIVEVQVDQRVSVD
jgi:hypothetical protein